MAEVRKERGLGFMGEVFQYRLINSFFVNPNFFKDLHSIIDQNMFSDNYLRTIVGIMQDYYGKYESVPSYSMLEIKINERQFNETEREIYKEVLERIRKSTTEGIEDIEASAEKFFTQQNWIRVANEILRIAGDGDMSKYEDCQRLINEALSIRRHDDIITNPFDNIEDDLSKENIMSIPTGISRLDEVLGGGLDKGKLGLIIASMGSGKTSLTTGIAAHAAALSCRENDYEGYRVLQICFEDTHRDIHRKYFGRFTGIETKDINSNAETTKNVRELLENYPDKEFIKNNIRIVRLKTGENSVSDIEKLIKKLINEGFKPDLVSIDYFECLKLEGHANEATHEKEGKTIRRLETLAADLDIALWVPTQGNRDSISTELITTDKMGGSIKKAQVAQVVLSITRSLEDSDNNRATIAVLKNRSGSAGRIIPVLFNNGTCTVTCEESVDFDDFTPKTYNEYTEAEEAREAKKLHDQTVRSVVKRD